MSDGPATDFPPRARTHDRTPKLIAFVAAVVVAAF
jgi:hypothetical protein